MKLYWPRVLFFPTVPIRDRNLPVQFSFRIRFTKGEKKLTVRSPPLSSAKARRDATGPARETRKYAAAASNVVFRRRRQHGFLLLLGWKGKGPLAGVLSFVRRKLAGERPLLPLPPSLSLVEKSSHPPRGEETVGRGAGFAIGNI